MGSNIDPRGLQARPVFSLDQIDVMIHPDHRFMSCVREWLQVDHVRNSIRPVYIGATKTKHSIAFDGCHVEVPMKRESTEERIIYDFDGLIRFGFNPNRASLVTYDLLSRSRVHHVTRVDVALDYSGLDMGSLAVSKSGVKSTRIFGRGHGSAVETVYLGSPRSNRYVRVYNKALEFGLNERLTRFEAVVRRPEDDSIPKNLFKGVQVFGDVSVDELGFHDAALVSYALDNPDRLQLVAKNTRKRIRNLVGASSGFEVDVMEHFQAVRSDLDEQLHEVLHGDLIIQPIDLYQEYEKQKPPHKRNPRTAIRGSLADELAMCL